MSLFCRYSLFCCVAFFELQSEKKCTATKKETSLQHSGSKRSFFFVVTLSQVWLDSAMTTIFEFCFILQITNYPILPNFVLKNDETIFFKILIPPRKIRTAALSACNICLVDSEVIVPRPFMNLAVFLVNLI